MNWQLTIHRIRSWLFRPTIWIFSLGLLAVFVRLYHLDSVPPGIHFDEIINSEIAANARNEGLRIFYLPGWGREGLYHAFLAASMSLPLPIAWQMRLPAVVISILGLLPTYGWVNRNFGKWAAVVTFAFALHWLRWCIAAAKVTRVVCYNPKRKEGEAYRRKVDGEAFVLSMSAFSHPNVIYGDDHIVPGAVTKEKTARRVNDWTEPPPEDYEVDSARFEWPDFMVGYVAHTSVGKPYSPISSCKSPIHLDRFLRGLPQLIESPLVRRIH